MEKSRKENKRDQNIARKCIEEELGRYKLVVGMSRVPSLTSVGVRRKDLR